jgi:hypothetical protein
MSAKLDDALRRTFLAIADVLIPEAEGMPMASQVGVGGEILDRMLALRPDLREGFCAAYAQPLKRVNYLVGTSDNRCRNAISPLSTPNGPS